MEDLLRKALCLGWVKKEHLCFHGTDIRIPQHPSRKRAKINREVSKRYYLYEVTPAQAGACKSVG
jgi:hypothetical protein